MDVDDPTAGSDCSREPALGFARRPGALHLGGGSPVSAAGDIAIVNGVDGGWQPMQDKLRRQQAQFQRCPRPKVLILIHYCIFFPFLFGRLWAVHAYRTVRWPQLEGTTCDACFAPRPFLDGLRQCARSGRKVVTQRLTQRKAGSDWPQRNSHLVCLGLAAWQKKPELG